MKVTIHQCEHLIHLSLLHKFSQADTIVLFDSAQYKKNYYENRNKIRVNNEQGWDYITVPVEGSNHKPINQVFIADVPWRAKYLQKVKSSYTNSPYFKPYYKELETLINLPFNLIVDLNMTLIDWLLQKYDIHKQVITAGELRLNSELRASERLLEICQKVGATEYLSGPSGKDYLDLTVFGNQHIGVKFHEFFHPVYKQQYEPFVCGLSAIDALFNYGPKAKDLLLNKGAEALKILLEKIGYKNTWRTLEMFGGDGSGHLTAYAKECNDLEIWELDPKNCIKLNDCYPKAKIMNTDTLKQVKIRNSKFDLVICDAPALMPYNGLLEEARKLVKSGGWLIYRNINHSFNNDNRVVCNEHIPNTIIIDQPREYYNFKCWLSNIAVQVT